MGKIPGSGAVQRDDPGAIPDMQQAAFFDMDKTLIAVNSARLWVEYMWREGELGKRDLLRSMVGLLGYKLAVVDVDKLAREAVARLRGESEAEMRDRIERWYEREIRPTIRSSMRDVVERHRQRGHHLVLLTASSPYVATPLANDLDIEHVISTRFEIADGCFTGRLEEPICYGRGKVTLSETWAKQNSVELGTSWFYTDSFTDVPMLRRVGNPIAVSPDPRLGRWARQNGVQVLAGV